jgi:hypothetical protein
MKHTYFTMLELVTAWREAGRNWRAMELDEEADLSNALKGRIRKLDAAHRDWTAARIARAIVLGEDRKKGAKWVH